MASNKKDLKAYVRYDGTGRVIAGSLILQRSKPKVGNWKETPAYECCNPGPISITNFDVTADWSRTTPAVTDEASFRTFLESGQDGFGAPNNFINVTISDFSLVGGRLRCNLSADADGNDFYMMNMGITDVQGLGDLQNMGDSGIILYTNNISVFDPAYPLPSPLRFFVIEYNPLVDFNPSLPLPNSLKDLYLRGNQIVTFDPTLPLPNSLERLFLINNQIVTFNPSIALPDSLQNLELQYNQIVTFNPTLPLPSSLEYLGLSGNRIIDFNPTLPLPSSLRQFDLDGNQIVVFNPSVPLPNSLIYLYLNDNQMTTAGYTASEPWANAMSMSLGGEIVFYGNIDSISGTNLETILIAKGWTVNG